MRVTTFPDDGRRRSGNIAGAGTSITSSHAVSLMLHGVPVRLIPACPALPRDRLRELRTGRSLPPPHHLLRTSILNDIGLRSAERTLAAHLIQLLQLLLALTALRLALQVASWYRDKLPA